jgi:hypothetical protein
VVVAFAGVAKDAVAFSCVTAEGLLAGATPDTLMGGVIEVLIGITSAMSSSCAALK